ncbi:MAG: hypothetical protein CM15mP129_08470 [Chloroflexota bacterium]|nr:MAG: hypothetical protein CM15mP129_08470 [Chloroflexota bacterium]
MNFDLDFISSSALPIEIEFLHFKIIDKSFRPSIKKYYQNLIYKIFEVIISLAFPSELLWIFINLLPFSSVKILNDIHL